MADTRPTQVPHPPLQAFTAAGALAIFGLRVVYMTVDPQLLFSRLYLDPSFLLLVVLFLAVVFVVVIVVAILLE